MMSRSNTAPAIKSVHVLSTGSGEQHKEHRYGSRLPVLWWVFTSRSWIKVPINAYVLEHRDGLVLFDTGIDPAILSDANYISSAVGRLLLRKIFRLHVSAEDTLSRKLEALEFSPSAVRTVVISHLHFDHVGGCYDVMGDGSMTLLQTPGHTPGSMSLLVRSEGLPPLLLVGDLTYEADLLMNDQVPGIGDAAQLRSSFAKVRALKEQLPGLVILPSHDPAVADALTSATLS